MRQTIKRSFYTTGMIGLKDWRDENVSEQGQKEGNMDGVYPLQGLERREADTHQTRFPDQEGGTGV